MSYTILQVRKGKEQSIFRKHPWIFSGALFTDTKEIEDGEIVESYEEINLSNLIEKHIDSLPYSENVKETLKKVSSKFYQETLKELEEKRSYENQID